LSIFANMATANGNGTRDAGITDSEHFSPYRADGKLVCFAGKVPRFVARDLARLGHKS
jgi:hypothetical protein